MHDSILWIGDKDDLQGTATSTIQMLTNIGKGLQIKRNGTIERFKEERSVKLENSQIRLWSTEEILAECFTDMEELLIENDKVLIGDTELNLGDECNIKEGVYKIKSIAQSRSKRNAAKMLTKSLAVYLG